MVEGKEEKQDATSADEKDKKPKGKKPAGESQQEQRRSPYDKRGYVKK